MKFTTHCSPATVKRVLSILLAPLILVLANSVSATKTEFIAENILFLIDTSGSTQVGKNDCDNSGKVDAGDNFSPNDKTIGTALDCETGLAMALNTRLGGSIFTSTAVMFFSGESTLAQDFMSPTDYDADNNDIPEFDETLIKGPGDPTEETNFSGALNMATDLLSELPEDERRSIFLISDGHFANSKGDLAYAEKENIFVTVFAVGHDAKTCRGAPLQTIVETTGGTCIEVTDIQSAVDSYFNGTNLDSQLKFD